MKTLPHVLILLLLTALLPVVAWAQTATVDNAAGDLRALLAMKGDPVRGKTVYVQCEDCHRKDGSGRSNGLFPNLAGQHASVIVKQLVDIRAGRRVNAAMQPLVAEPVLSGSAIVDVAAYLQSLPTPANNGKGPETALARGKQLYDQDCASCHGAMGEGDAAKFHPMVAAQHYRYLLREMVTIRDGARRNSDPEMVRRILPYSAADIEAVSDHMSRFAPPKR